ncbi:hypothetical protein CC78DRAFT_29790 [Lojkania enalia]|uniref:Uncharacterized protein n=1 Tax=Lojkania enalia TaxID=147567 RepID=A0A9P4N090_9PLEO|nr:hypothetical protein CC78DRAFT_29790 [Didymosphaeria enalia]
MIHAFIDPSIPSQISNQNTLYVEGAGVRPISSSLRFRVPLFELALLWKIHICSMHHTCPPLFKPQSSASMRQEIETKQKLLANARTHHLIRTFQSHPVCSTPQVPTHLRLANFVGPKSLFASVGVSALTDGFGRLTPDFAAVHVLRTRFDTSDVSIILERLVLRRGPEHLAKLHPMLTRIRGDTTVYFTLSTLANKTTLDTILRRWHRP